jgi:Do/DeqQ family serine protease
MSEQTSMRSERRSGRFVSAVAVAAALSGMAAGVAWRGGSAVQAAPAGATTATVPVVVGGPQLTSYASVVERVTPAVVTIRTERKATAMPADLPFDEPMLREFFGRNGRNFQGQGGARPRMPLQRGLGSGVVLSADGYILTNHHVVENADRISVELSDKRVLTAKVVGDDAPSDLALLRVEAAGLPALPMADSDRAKVGDVVLAVGNPLGVGQTVTAGIISAKGRTTGSGDGSFQDFLQTDAPINQGNSGGALVNLQGELLGINSQILSTSGGNIGLGFAIPANQAKHVVDQLKSNGRVQRARLGVVVQPMTADLASSLNLTDVRGALVSQVSADTPAARAGLKQGDVILAVDGRQVADGNDLRNAVANTAPGKNITVTILRDGRQQSVSARLEAAPSEAEAEVSLEGAAKGEKGKFGMSVSPITPELAERLSLPRSSKGVVVTDVDPDGQAAAADVQPGDVIEQINGKPTGTVNDLRAALERTGDKPNLVLVKRNGTSLFLTLRADRS